VTFDGINKKFGKDTMLLGRLITPNGRKWAMNQNFNPKLFNQLGRDIKSKLTCLLV
jgi:hypothetical protein